MYNTQNTTILVIFVNAYVCKLYNLECMHAIIICKNNTVFAKSDFWSKTRQPAPVSLITLRITLRRSMYHFAYHVASHFIALYFILLVYHCVCESNSVGL